MARTDATSLRIQALYGLEICVHDARPWLEFLRNGFGFQQLSVDGERAVETSGDRRHLLRCGDVRMILREPVHEGGFVRRFLDRHPEGISALILQAVDAESAEGRLLERGATPLDFIREEEFNGTRWKQFSIATPLGDVALRLTQIDGQGVDLPPGMEQLTEFDPAHNPLGLRGLDHLTTNNRTLMPVIAFFEQILEFERIWDVQFHPELIRPGAGGGLKSVVMREPASGLRLAHNEPLRPRYEWSQVAHAADMNHGPGIHHVAFAVEDIFRAVDHCRGRDVQFLSAPRPYYEALPERLKSTGMQLQGATVEDLRQRDVLIDGGRGGHMLQIFCRDQSEQFKRPEAGPLFFELLQRRGWEGFGEGNFRALFEAAHRDES